MNADAFIKGKLADFCIREGMASGGADKMIAVAHVLRNRIDGGWYGGDWLLNLQAAEISRGSALPTHAVVLNLKDGHIKVFMQRIDDIYHGPAEDETNGALYYADLHNITNEWFRDNIARDRANHPLVATIGQTTFFR